MLKIGLDAFPSNQLGQAFIHLAYYFSYCFPYEETIEEGEVKMKLNLIDPINYTNNVGGRHTETEKVRDMFKAIDHGIRIKINGTSDPEILPFLFQLNRIFTE